MVWLLTSLKKDIFSYSLNSNHRKGNNLEVSELIVVTIVLSVSSLCFKSVNKISRHIMRWSRGLLGGSAEQEVRDRGEL